MRKKIWLVAAFVAVIITAAIGATTAFAQPTTVAPDGSDWNMADYCYGAGGMMDGYGGVTDQATLTRVAGVVGLTYEQLTARLTQGETIAQVAKAQGVTTSAVVDSILAPQNEMIQLRVRYGYLTDAQAKAMLEQMRYWIEQTIVTPQYGTTINPTGGYTQQYAPGYGGGMMGGGWAGGGMMGGRGMMGGW